VLLSWFLSLSGFRCASETLTQTCWEHESPLRIKLSVGTWWDLLPVVWGMHPGDKGGDNSPSSIIPANAQVMLREIMSWDRNLCGRLAGSNIYCASTDPADSCPKAASREQRCLTLCTLASRLQKLKAKLNPHMAAYDFIGCFISPVLCDLHVSIL
jgi:hypothetical protein